MACLGFTGARRQPFTAPVTRHAAYNIDGVGDGNYDNDNDNSGGVNFNATYKNDGKMIMMIKR